MVGCRKPTSRVFKHVYLASNMNCSKNVISDIKEHFCSLELNVREKNIMQRTNC